MRFDQTDIGMSVTNEDLRNEITRLSTNVKNLTEAIKDLRTANESGITERRTDGNRITALYAGLSVLRWAVGLVAAAAGWMFYSMYGDLKEATRMNTDQQAQIMQMHQNGLVRDSRLQALERGQFADQVKQR